MKICESCGVEREISEYKNPTSTVCNFCKNERIRLRKERYSQTNLGVEALDSTLPYITRIKNDTKFAYQVSFEKAKELVERGEAIVYASDTIYSLTQKTPYEKLKYKYRKVLEEANYTCYYCGKYGDTIDHVIPKAKKGGNVKENLVCSCVKCNQSKGDMSVEEFKVDKFEKMLKSALNKSKY